MSDNDLGGDKGAAVLAVLQRGAEFAKELMAENHELREQLRGIETRQREAAQNPHDWGKLRQELLGRITSLETENRDMMAKLMAVKTENRQFVERYVEIEEENNRLANLYVASYQLHSTLDPAEVMKAIIEIVINLIGAELFCIYVCDDENGTLEAVAAEGRPVSDFPKLPTAEGFVGESVSTGRVMSRDRVPERESRKAPIGDPLVSIPLCLQERRLGAIAIHRLLQQKEHGFTALDHEMFTLLAGHASTALFAAELHSQSERKLSTIKGLIDLLTR